MRVLLNANAGVTASRLDTFYVFTVLMTDLPVRVYVNTQFE